MLYTKKTQKPKQSQARLLFSFKTLTLKHLISYKGLSLPVAMRKPICYPVKSHINSEHNEVSFPFSNGAFVLVTYNASGEENTKLPYESNKKMSSKWMGI